MGGLRRACAKHHEASSVTGVLGSEVREVVGLVLSETSHLVYSSVDGHLDCLHFGAVTESAVMGFV